MVALKEVDGEIVANLERKLQMETTSLPEKYRILFSLRNIKGEGAHRAMLKGLLDGSALYRHEVAYCLGQRQDPAAIQTLSTILNDSAEHPMVRHEAGEALGAIGTQECFAPLRGHQEDPCMEVAQTCQLALQRIEFFQSPEGRSLIDNSPYMSVDPTPPADASLGVEKLRECLLDENEKIFDRYRAMFALRNIGGEQAIEALTTSFETSTSALLKHEVAYVLGQMQDAGAVDRLQRVLENGEENPMVRHEAAEALGSIGSPYCLDLLKKFASDREPIVADSCVVALDMLTFENSGEFEYAAKT